MEKTVQACAEAREEQLAMAVNGEVFADPSGKFSKIREQLLAGMPGSLWLQKIATAAALLAQAGQYNYARCMRRGDTTAASFALWEFLRETVHIEYLLHRAYMPYYKWAWRGMERLSGARELQRRTEVLAKERPEICYWQNDRAVEGRNEINWNDPVVCQIEQICAIILGQLREQQLTYGKRRFPGNPYRQNFKGRRTNEKRKYKDHRVGYPIRMGMFQNVRDTWQSRLPG